MAPPTPPSTILPVLTTRDDDGPDDSVHPKIIFGIVFGLVMFTVLMAATYLLVIRRRTPVAIEPRGRNLSQRDETFRRWTGVLEWRNMHRRDADGSGSFYHVEDRLPSYVPSTTMNGRDMEGRVQAVPMPDRLPSYASTAGVSDRDKIPSAPPPAYVC